MINKLRLTHLVSTLLPWCLFLPISMASAQTIVDDAVNFEKKSGGNSPVVAIDNIVQKYIPVGSSAENAILKLKNEKFEIIYPDTKSKSDFGRKDIVGIHKIKSFMQWGHSHQIIVILQEENGIIQKSSGRVRSKSF